MAPRPPDRFAIRAPVPDVADGVVGDAGDADLQRVPAAGDQSDPGAPAGGDGLGQDVLVVLSPQPEQAAEGEAGRVLDHRQVGW